MRAACSRRAATFTASPVTKPWPREESPAITSPVFTPVRARSRTPHRASSCSFSSASAVRMSTAARTARSASSSRTVGMPKTAITASPMYFSTVPPWRSITVRISLKYRWMTSRRDSGSSSSPSAVEPVTSQNRTVTVLRAVGGGPLDRQRGRAGHAEAGAGGVALAAGRAERHGRSVVTPEAGFAPPLGRRLGLWARATIGRGGRRGTRRADLRLPRDQRRGGRGGGPSSWPRAPPSRPRTSTGPPTTSSGSTTAR